MLAPTATVVYARLYAALSLVARDPLPSPGAATGRIASAKARMTCRYPAIYFCN